MIKHIFFDFNGTLINDVDLCLGLLNETLRGQAKKEINMDKYKNIFTFPIKRYYELAGIDFNIESYSSLAIKFVEKYQPLSLKCGLYDCVVDTLHALKKSGYKLYVLSASEKNNLIQQCNHYDISKYFDEILGIDNIHAGGKVDIAKEFVKANDIKFDEAIFIGDTLHDYEVAEAMGIDCRLVSCGHQSVSILSKAGVPIYDDISKLKEELL